MERAREGRGDYSEHITFLTESNCNKYINLARLNVKEDIPVCT